jgi:hypothetical protein
LYVPNSNETEEDVTFQGKYESSKDDLDAILIFKDGECTLEVLSGQVTNFRYAAPC